MYMNETTIIILAVVAVIAVYTVLPYLMRVVFNKGRDSVRNANIRNQEANNPPGKVRLADRYYGTKAGESLGLVEQKVPEAVNTVNESQDVLSFCPYCGMNLSQMEKDDLFCPNCGARLR